MTTILEASGVTKSYAGVQVVKDASIALHRGRVRSIVGENGAGKSTLMRMLTGATRPDQGRIVLDGETVSLSGPALRRGVVMVHQELALARDLSVEDNILLARPPGSPWRWRGSRAGRRFVESALAQVSLDVAPGTPVGRLSIGQAYLVEIAKALALDAQVVILDEPTAALPGDASEVILGHIRALREQGRAVGFISHRLAEVLDVSDDITVMRDGRVVADFSEPVTEDELIRIMVDREVGLYRAARPDHADRVLLSVDGLTTDHVRDVTFDAREGEIVGFAGLVGAGRTEAALAVAGADAVRSGSVRVDGQEMAGRSVARLRRAGVVLVPEDRKGQGIAPGLSVHENLHLGNLPAFTRFGLLDGRRLRRASEELRGRFDIRLRSLNQHIETLSGGNQQKAILARAMETKPKVLVLDEPTRGVDVRAKDEIHQMILRLAAQGTTVLLISSELEEVMALSHRLVVFAEGTVTGQLVNDESVTPETVMRLATPRSVRMGARIA